MLFQLIVDLFDRLAGRRVAETRTQVARKRMSLLIAVCCTLLFVPAGMAIGALVSTPACDTRVCLVNIAIAVGVPFLIIALELLYISCRVRRMVSDATMTAMISVSAVLVSTGFILGYLPVVCFLVLVLLSVIVLIVDLPRGSTIAVWIVWSLCWTYGAVRLSGLVPELDSDGLFELPQTALFGYLLVTVLVTLVMAGILRSSRNDILRHNKNLNDALSLCRKLAIAATQFDTAAMKTIQMQHAMHARRDSSRDDEAPEENSANTSTSSADLNKNPSTAAVSTFLRLANTLDQVKIHLPMHAQESVATSHLSTSSKNGLVSPQEVIMPLGFRSTTSTNSFNNSANQQHDSDGQARAGPATRMLAPAPVPLQLNVTVPCAIATIWAVQSIDDASMNVETEPHDDGAASDEVGGRASRLSKSTLACWSRLVTEAANGTGASLEGQVGARITVSWGFTARRSQPHLSARNFFDAVLRTAQAVGLSVVGAAMDGAGKKARHAVGNGQQYMITMPWSAAFAKLQKVAASQQAMLVSFGSELAAPLDDSLVPLDVLVITTEARAQGKPTACSPFLLLEESKKASLATPANGNNRIATRPRTPSSNNEHHTTELRRVSIALYHSLSSPPLWLPALHQLFRHRVAEQIEALEFRTSQTGESAKGASTPPTQGQDLLQLYSNGKIDDRELISNLMARIPQKEMTAISAEFPVHEYSHEHRSVGSGFDFA